MNVSETCSCGASFQADGDTVVRLLREWRKVHPCHETKPEASSETIFTSANSYIESAPIGFAPFDLPGRQDPGLDE